LTYGVTHAKNADTYEGTTPTVALIREKKKRSTAGLRPAGECA
jgi:hypothetical protein